MKSTHQEKDFIKKCYDIAQNPTVSPKDVRLCSCYGAYSYRKVKEIDNHNKEFAESDYVGVVGKRQNFFLKLLDKKFILTMIVIYIHLWITERT